MNGNDLMNALSGLDPKYIDEAAFELHDVDRSADITQIKKAKVLRMKKFLLVSIPAAAVILLSITVTLPFLMRMSKSTATAPASDYADSAAPAAEEAAEAPAEASPVYEAEESAESNVKTAGSAETAAADSVESAEEYAAAEEAEAAYIPALEKAVYEDGILTVDISGTLPYDAEELAYTITSAGDDGVETTVSEGTLGDILKERDPLTLDLTKLDLKDGTYTLSIGDESVEFTVEP